MTTILIVCGAGASSTFLASAMRTLAQSRGIQATIHAASDDDLDSRLPFADVVLVGERAETALELASGIAPAGRLALHPQPKEIPHG
jgi:PTS system cellobiose-specific IIB component